MMFVAFTLLTIITVINGQTNCQGANTCPNQGFCNPNTFQCAADKEHLECEHYGNFASCSNLTNYGSGIIMSECGSGENADCSNKGGCGGDTWFSFECDYPELAPVSGYKLTGWHCGHYGSQLSCSDYGGSVLIGLCGSGKNAIALSKGNYWHCIICAQQQYFNISWKECAWESGHYGDWITCNKGATVAADIVVW